VTEPVFLDVEDVLLIHQGQLGSYGGAAGVRDEGLLESAAEGPVLRPAANSFTRTSTRWPRPTPSTSRRTSRSSTGTSERAFSPALVFLDLNGVAVPDPAGRLYDAMIAIAEHRMDKASLRALLSELAVRSE